MTLVFFKNTNTYFCDKENDYVYKILNISKQLSTRKILVPLVHINTS